jgi:YD repeat-containing protein
MIKLSSAEAGSHCEHVMSRASLGQADGRQTFVHRDAWVLLTYAPDGGQLASVTQAGRTSTFAYGPNGLLVRATDALLRPTTYTYSSAQRLDSVTAPTTEVTRWPPTAGAG